MKKIKWILLIIMILFAILFLFATCRHTNALEKPFNQGQSLRITRTDNNSGFIGIYEINNNSVGTTPFYITWSGGYSYITITTYSSNQDYYTLTYSISGYGIVSRIQAKKSDSLYFYVVAGGNDYDISLQFGYVLINKNGSNASITESYNNYYYSNIAGQDYDVINGTYNSNDGINIYPLALSSDSAINYTYNYYVFDILDYGTTTFSEYVEDVKDDYFTVLSSNYLNLYNSGYQDGYNAGYQLGYDEGYTAGQTAGYNSGYQAGYNAGVNDNETAYNRGYDDGYADGYRAGVVYGYDDGYETGYNVGFDEGLQGATPVSQTVTLLGSIFGAIGTVLSIQLFPGFTLGLLILVPLFFAVLGLILWIWRRN